MKELNFSIQDVGRYNQFMLALRVGNISDDTYLDKIFLTGSRTPNSPFVQNITLVVQDGQTLLSRQIPLKTNEGYSPSLFVADFTDDGLEDILVTINSGGSGGTTYNYIYTYVNDEPNLIFDYEQFNEEYIYTVTYLDNFRVRVVSLKNNSDYIIDISEKGSEYLNEIYNQDGTLKEPVEGFVGPLAGLYPIDFDMDGQYELLAFQTVSGRYAADALGYMETTLKWDGEDFGVFNQYLGVLDYYKDDEI